VTKEVCRADDLHRSMAPKPKDLQWQQVPPVVCDHEACVGLHRAGKHWVVGGVAWDDIELVRSRDDVREVAQQPEEGVDLCIRQASEHTHLGLAQHAIDLGEEVVGCDQAQPAVADGVE